MEKSQNSSRSQSPQNPLVIRAYQEYWKEEIFAKRYLNRMREAFQKRIFKIKETMKLFNQELDKINKKESSIQENHDEQIKEDNQKLISDNNHGINHYNNLHTPYTEENRNINTQNSNTTLMQNKKVNLVRVEEQELDSLNKIQNHRSIPPSNEMTYMEDGILKIPFNKTLQSL